MGDMVTGWDLSGYDDVPECSVTCPFCGNDITYAYYVEWGCTHYFCNHCNEDIRPDEL